MKINFTEEEKMQVSHLIDEYASIDKEYIELKRRTDELDERMKNLNQEENILMSALKVKYGNFTLQDINDSLC